MVWSNNREYFTPQYVKWYREKNYILTPSLSLSSCDNNANKATADDIEFLSMACYNKTDFVTFTENAQSFETV